MLPGKEEEGLVLDRWSTDIGTKLVLVQRSLSQTVVVAEPVVRFQIRVANVLIGASVKGVRTALGNNLNNTAAVAAKLRAYVAGGNAKLLHGILSGYERIHIVL